MVPNKSPSITNKCWLEIDQGLHFTAASNATTANSTAYHDRIDLENKPCDSKKTHRTAPHRRGTG